MPIVFLFVLFNIGHLIHSLYAILYKVIDHQLQVMILLARATHSIQPQTIQQLLNVLMVLLG